MTKPDFKQMPRSELRAYVLAHRDDQEAIHELFINRSNPNAKVYPAPSDAEGIRIMSDAINQKVKQQLDQQS